MTPAFIARREDGTSRPFETEIVNRVQWLISLRWLAAASAALLSLGAVVVFGVSLPLLPLLAISIVIAGYNLAFQWVVGRLLARPVLPIELFKRIASAQFLTDWVALVVLLHFTGGINSPLIFYFVFHAIIGSILLPPRAAYIHAVIGVVLVGALAFLEMKNIIPHEGIPTVTGEDFDQPLHVFVKCLFFTTAIFASVYLASAITKRLQDRMRELVALKRDLEEALHRTRTLYNIAQAVSSSLNQKDVLDTVTWLAARSMNVKACSIRLLDETSGKLVIAAAWGLSDAYLSKGPVDPDKAIVDREVLKGHPVAIEDVAMEQGLFQYPDEAVREGIRSVLCVPLTVRDKRIGILRLYTGLPHRFTQEEIDFVVTLANQSAIAIENARTYKHLEELERAKSKFVFSVAHELKAPVAAVIGRLTTLLEGYAGEITEKQREIIVRAIKRIGGLQILIQDLLALGALEGRVPDAPAADIDCRKTIEDVIEVIQPEVDRKGLSLRVQLPEEPVEVRAAEEDIRRLIANLIENAVKYTRAGGTVEVTLDVADGMVIITVSDTGIGIPPQAIPHIFDEFYRAKNAKELGEEGTGLGLALVKRIVDLYHGQIRVDSEVDKGTTFMVKLPVGGDATHPGLDLSDDVAGSSK